MGCCTNRFGLATYAAALSISTSTRAYGAGHDYSAVFNKDRDTGIKFDDLPGKTK